jgi:hypothetical protein
LKGIEVAGAGGVVKEVGGEISEGCAALPCCAEAGINVAGIRGEANGGIEIECGESGEAGAALPSEAEVSTSSSIDQWEAGEAGAAAPSAARS